MPNGRKKKEYRQENGSPALVFPLPHESSTLAKNIVSHKQVQNIGLFFNKFVCVWDDDWTLDAKVKEEKREKSVKSWFLEQVETIARSFPQDVYYAFLDRQVKIVESLREYGYKTIVFGKRAEARILSGLGGAHPMEVGFAFHPFYGFPYLPGSGLKGVARTWAELTGEDPGKIKLVFGSESKDERRAKEYQQGDVLFFDAYAITPPRLEVDILNPHFPEYYRDPKNNLPTEWQNPNPVNFLTIGGGCDEKDKHIFQFALAARSKEALDLAQQWLERGLERLGFGGKTASGYGYFAEGRFPAQQFDELCKAERAKAQSAKAQPVKAPSAQAPSSVTQSAAQKRPPISAPPVEKAKASPAPAKPVAKPTVKQGDKLEAAVVANDGRRVTVRLLGGFDQEVTFERAYYPHPPGKKVKIKVMSVTAKGRVTKIAPA